MPGMPDLQTLIETCGSLANNPPPDDPQTAIDAAALVEQLQSFQAIFLQIQKSIFLDLAAQLEAYANGGLQGILWLHDENPQLFDYNTVKAWTLIDSGIPSNVEQGNLLLLTREQQQVVLAGYAEIARHWATGPAFI